MIGVRAGSATDVGLVRTTNQDQLLVESPLFAVADGMGGAAAGEVASAVAIEGLRDAFDSAGEPTSQTLVDAAQAANRAVWEKAEAHAEMRGMGTTLVALALTSDGRLAAVNVGDSRLYRLHDGELQQVTADHNLVAEMVAEGRLSQEEAEVHPRRNIMTRALGVDPDVPVDLFALDAQPGDRYLLCSDGLPREVADALIESLLRRLADPQEVASELVDEAKRRGGSDNVTVVVVDVVDGDAAQTGVVKTDAGKDSAATTMIPAAAPDRVARQTETQQAEKPSSVKRRRNKPSRPLRARFITWRVGGFFVLLLAVAAAAAAGIGWYARGGYFVGLRGQQITIFQGRPGGLLWFQPTVARATTVTTSQVEPRHIPEVAAGQQEPTLTAASQYVDRLVAEKKA
ncbi:MAG: Stp1/IreP family PP2C-type Ser/Thr phosphatase, partial [Acidimicrobiales bacterium]